MVGEIASKFKGSGKKIGIIHRGPRLVPHLPFAASEAVEDQLKSMGVNVYLNTTFNDKTQKDLKYDMVI